MAMYIPEHEVRANLTYEKLIPAIRQALIDLSAGLVDQPPRTIAGQGTPEGSRNGWFAVMPVIAGDYLGVKTVTFYPGNAELGLHTHMAVVELLRRATGEPLAVMDGRLITEMRTGGRVSGRAGCAGVGPGNEPGNSGIRRAGALAFEGAAHGAAGFKPTSASGAGRKKMPIAWPTRWGHGLFRLRKPRLRMWC